MSRRLRGGVIGLCILTVCLAIAIDRTRSRKSITPNASKQQILANDISKYHGKSFLVAKIVDGDTIDIDIPDGQYKNTRVRLWGVDTPETKSQEFGVMYFGPESAEFTAELTSDKTVEVYLDTDNGTRGKYGRLLAYIKLDEGKILNEELLRQGLAYADLRFRHSYYNKYQQLQAAAKSTKKGLWKEVKREQLPEWLQRMKPKLLLKK